jgi:hypothetical protein
VSVISQQIKDEYRAWAAVRRPDGITPDYLVLDASFFRMQPSSPAEPVLAAWGSPHADHGDQDAAGAGQQRRPLEGRSPLGTEQPARVNAD